MIIYNITVNIDESVHNEWLEWMQTEHIANMIATGKFTSARLVKVLVNEDMGGVTYSVQYASPDKETLDAYYKENEAALDMEARKRFADKMLTFCTELEIISEH